MILKNIKIENFLSISSLDFNLESAGTVVVVGNNGAGKSSVLEAIYYALFGKLYRGLRYSDAVVNNTAKKNCAVILTLSIPEGEVVISRYRKHSVHKNAITLTLNGQEVQSVRSQETQKTIEALLKIDQDTFSRVVLIGQGLAKKFTDMSDKELKEFIEGLTGGSLFSSAFNAVRDEYSDLDSRRLFIEGQLEILNSSLTRNQQLLEEETEKITREKESHVQEINTLQILIANTTREIAEIEKKLRDFTFAAEAEIKKKEEEEAKVISSLRLLEDNRENLAKSKRSLEEEVRNSFDSEISTMETWAKTQQDTVVSHIIETTALLQRKQDIYRETEKKGLNEATEIQAKFSKDIQNITEMLSNTRGSLKNLPRLPNMPLLESEKNRILSDLEELQNKLSSILDSVCPTCSQKLTKKMVDAIANTTIYPEMGTLNENLDKITKEIEYNQKVTLEIENSRKSLEIMVETLQNSLDAVHAAEKEAREEAQSRNSALLLSIQEEIRGVQVNLSGLQDQKSEILNKLAVFKKDIEAKIRESSTKKTVDLLKQLMDVDNQIAEKNSMLQAIRSSLSQLTRGHDNTSLKDELDKKRKLVEKTEERIEGIKNIDYYIRWNHIHQDLSRSQEEVDKRKVELDEIKEDVYISDYLKKMFGTSGIRSYLLDGVLQDLNRRLYYYCDKVFDSLIRVSLKSSTEQKSGIVEKIDIVVTTDGGCYALSSGGEQRKVDIVLLLAFRDFSRNSSTFSCNVEAYDEIFSFLDADSTNRIANILAGEKSADTKIIITHRNDFSLVFPHKVVNVVKKEGYAEYNWS